MAVEVRNSILCCALHCCILHIVLYIVVFHVPTQVLTHEKSSTAVQVSGV